jgi:ELWxxDGT repeat protein
MKKQLVFVCFVLSAITGIAQLPVVIDVNKDYYNTDPVNLYAAGNVMYFAANGNNGLGSELWKTDGTPEGTVMVKDITTGPLSSNLGNFCLVGNTVFFSAGSDAFGNIELWKTDGTTAGTLLVKEINPGNQSSVNGGFINYKGILLFRQTMERPVVNCGGQMVRIRVRIW